MTSPDTTYLWLNDAQAGPFTALQLRSMWTAGTITAATLCWQEGMEEWTPLGSAVEEAIAAEKKEEQQLLHSSSVASAPQKRIVTSTPPTNPQEALKMGCQLIIWGAVLIFLLKGCVFKDRSHEERPLVTASSSEAHDYRDGFNIGLEVGKKNGRPGSGYSIPTKEALFQLSAFALMGHSPSDKQEFMRGWRDGYKLGFKQTSEKAL